MLATVTIGTIFAALFIYIIISFDISVIMQLALSGIVYIMAYVVLVLFLQIYS